MKRKVRRVFGVFLGYRQSFSGSDSTSSTENLTVEDRHELHNSTRQEPQGQETQQPNVISDTSVCSRLRIDSSIPELDLATIDDKFSNLDSVKMSESKGDDRVGPPDGQNLGRSMQGAVFSEQKKPLGLMYEQRLSEGLSLEQLAMIKQYGLSPSQFAMPFNRMDDTKRFGVNGVPQGELPPPPEYPGVIGQDTLMQKPPLTGVSRSVQELTKVGESKEDLGMITDTSNANR